MRSKLFRSVALNLAVLHDRKVRVDPYVWLITLKIPMILTFLKTDFDCGFDRQALGFMTCMLDSVCRRQHFTSFRSHFLTLKVNRPFAAFKTRSKFEIFAPC